PARPAQRASAQRHRSPVRPGWPRVVAARARRDYGRQRGARSPDRGGGAARNARSVRWQSPRLLLREDSPDTISPSRHAAQALSERTAAIKLHRESVERDCVRTSSHPWSQLSLAHDELAFETSPTVRRIEGL